MFLDIIKSIRQNSPTAAEKLVSSSDKCHGHLHARCYLLLLVAIGMSACASVPLREAGTLKTYGNLGDVRGNLAKRRDYVDGRRLEHVRRVSIVPTAFAAAAASKINSAADRSIVSNVLDRTLCVALSDKFELVPFGHQTDLTVRAVVTDIVTTDKAIAGVATAVSLGSAFVLPVGAPRLPIGLGGLAVEAEAVATDGDQLAAMVWARGANSFSNARVSEVGDAYALATSFANDFSEMLLKGRQPAELDLSLPSLHRVQSWLGSNPRYTACDNFGRSPGLVGIVGSRLGLPPQWTDSERNRLPKSSSE